ncbi:50S ribosomal protein L11 [Candidatus Roizmanbacteria bacterium RIFOXYB2_FULL_41_10]|uniref:Large ribosomal subunit protein uL11 n=1 Tax=Candidatus Roizmanbacteria bacterium RIFOXYA1_FULL_41_12 TaxID=1802082 RepID=A0A1F7KEK8_9BACT|nr:MAG: 50S ribosomal protein L11 [Candidatus Roizmanbacteria bacterium RIFOXYA1_FULL_41_12]OGK66643.1 MAG: 50S ribosomal protein L11 [Candidatus Roizmanbacteria bacterium RIFOXYA2_FULL_41_8]OGK67099.1 MAG: 50S ribosomal protein L11 [Candidatus Roizmanbacteria bacterium RIFOXYB1_FULL_41_27]OGK69040.1 MAG: 50S ribosomal protein L11 [Candidatus Roizmanbacteria bacterium RIFOXYB2_FULL_41_10]OGK75752.1 MAG: 50S ribosomal protein L11 [Candidatus Roizmanbacteria bacterium RIFOXYD1_FULL_41_24]
MAKKIKAVVKLNLNAGTATAAPPAGPVLGQHGVPIMDFVRQYNEATADKKGQIIPVVITIYEDRTFSFVTKLPPVTEAIKAVLKIKTGSGRPNKDKVGKLTQAQLTDIAKAKLNDLNTKDLEQAKKIVAGTARSMGIEVTN